MKYAVMAAAAILCLLCVLVTAWMVRRGGPSMPAPAPETVEPIAITNTTTIPPPTETPTDDPPPPTKEQTILVYYDALGRPYYPTLYEKHARRYSHHPYKRHYHPSPLEPAGGFPDLLGMQRDKAVQYVMSTFPNLTVATVRYGHRMPADTRMDRMIIVYDAFTGQVVSAYIG